MTAPTLTGFAPAPLLENDVNAAPRIIDGDVVLLDADGDLAGGRLRISGLLAEDIVSLLNAGTGAGQVGFDAATGEVTFGGVLIGVASGGSGSDFIIDFNGAATVAAVEAVIEHLTYANLSDSPTPTRSLVIDVIDAAGQSLTDNFPEVIATAVTVYDFGVGAMAAASAPIVTGDFALTGALDLWIGNTAGGLTYHQNGGGVLLALGYFAPNIASSGGTPVSLSSADLNSDGRIDLVAMDANGATRVHLSTGPDEYGLHPNLMVHDAAWSAALGALVAGPGSRLAVGDIDGNGTIDAVTSTADGRLDGWINGGAAQYSSVWNTAGGLGAPLNLTLADLDSDGDLDLLTVIEGAIQFAANDGTGQFSFVPNAFSGFVVSGPANLAVIDIDRNGSLDVLISDAGGLTVLRLGGPVGVFNLEVVPQPSVVTIGGLPDEVTFHEDEVAVTPGLLLTGDVTLTDTENGLPNGSLYIIGGSSPDDLFGLRHQGMGAGQIGVGAAGEVYFGGVQIGTLGAPGYALHVVFNGASLAAIEAVLENITYVTRSNTPTPMGLSISFYDNAGAQIGVDGFMLYLVDDPEQVSLADLNPTVRLATQEAAVPIRLDEAVTFQDVEGDFDGSVLTISGLAAGDIVSLAQADQISLTGGIVFFDGVAIGIAAGGLGGDFTVTLNADASSDAIDALFEALTFASPGAAVGPRLLTFTLVDAAGHALIPTGGGAATITVELYEKTAIAELAATLDLTLAEAATPRRLDADITLQGTVDDWAGAQLIITGLAPGDSFSLAQQGGVTLVDDHGAMQVQVDGAVAAYLYPGAVDFQIHFHGVVPGDVAERVIEALSFANPDPAADQLRTLNLRLNHPNGETSDRQVVVRIAGGFEHHAALSGFDPVVGIGENAANAGFQWLDPDLTLRDDDHDLAGSTLTVSGLSAEDVLGVISYGDVAWDAASGEVRVDGLLVGQTNGGEGQDFLIAFNAQATTAAIEAVLRNVGFRTPDDSPQYDRTLTFALTDAAGHPLVRTGDPGPVTLQVLVGAERDPLTAAGLDTASTFRENEVFLQPQPFLQGLTLGGEDDPSGSYLSVFGLSATDHFTVLAAGRVTVSGSHIFYDGIHIATLGSFTSGFTLSFAQAATLEAAQAALRQIAYSSSDQVPAADPRTFTGLWFLADGGNFNFGWTVTLVDQAEETGLEGVPTAVTLGEQAVNAGPQALTSGADIQWDPADTQIAGGRLTIGGLAAGDRITLLDSGGLTIDATTGEVWFNGVVVGGTVSVESVGLTVTFNADATEAAVEAILGALAFATADDTPIETRTLTVGLVNAHGHPALTSAGVAPTIAVTVTPAHDAPAIVGLPTELMSGEAALNGIGERFASEASIYAPDSSWGGATLTVTSSDPADILFYRSTGLLLLMQNEADGPIYLTDFTLTPVATLVSTGQSFQVEFGANASFFDVIWTLRGLAYRTSSEAPAATRQFSVSLVDGQGGRLDTDFAVAVTPQNDAHGLGGAADLAFLENDLNASPALLLADAVFTDVDGAFSGLITLSGFLAEDILSLQAFGAVAGMADIRAGTLAVGGATLTFDEAAGAVTIAIENSTAPLVQDILRNLAIANASHLPTAERDIIVRIEDETHSAEIAFAIQITSQYDTPRLTDLAASVTFDEQQVNASPQLLDGAITLNALEGLLDAASIVIGGLLAEDRLTLLSGNGLAFDSASGEVRIDGQLVAVASGGIGGDLTVIFVDDGTDHRDAAERILERLAYGNVSETPATSRTLSIDIRDGAGLPVLTAGEQIPSLTVGVTPVVDRAHFLGIGPMVLDEAAVNAGPVALPWIIDLYAPETPSFEQLFILVAAGHGQLTLDFSGAVQAAGGSITVNGVPVVSTFLDGGTSMSFRFTGLATAELIEELLSAVRYANTDDTLPDTNFVLRIQHETELHYDHVYVAPTTFVPQADAPFAIIPDLNVSETTLNYGAAELMPAVQVLDPEGDSGAVRITLDGFQPDDGLHLVGWAGLLNEIGVDLRGGPASFYLMDYGAQNLVHYDLTFSEADGVIAIDLGRELTDGQLQLLLRAIRMTNRDDLPTAGRSITLTIEDGLGGVSTADFDIHIQSVYDVPFLRDFRGDQAVQEQIVNAGPVRLDTDVTFDIPEGFRGAGRIVVYVFDASDRIGLLSDEILSYDSGTGEIRVADQLVAVASGGGVAGNPLVIQFTADPSQADRTDQLEAIFERLTYANVSDAPPAQALVRMTVTDGAGNGILPTSGFYIETRVAITPFNDPVVVTGITDVTLPQAALSTGGLRPMAGAVVNDIDGFQGGTLTISGFQPEDTLSLPALTFEPAIADLTVGSGSYLGDSIDFSLVDGVLTIDFSGPAAQVQILLSNLILSTTAGATRPTRTLTLSISPIDSGPTTLIQHIDVLLLAVLGSTGDDLLDPRTGDGPALGGAGNDTYIVDDPNDGVLEAAGEGTDVVRATVSYVLGANIENLTLEGTGDIDGTGNALANLITGNDGANVLSGADGVDRLYGGLGADDLVGGAGGDLLDGGAGADQMSGGLGDDTYVVDSALDAVIEASDSGSDRVRASVNFNLGATVENLQLFGTAVIGRGNELSNQIDGTDLNNSLNGGGGDDIVRGHGGADGLSGHTGNDMILGGEGDDTMSGGAGDDRLYGEAGRDLMFADDGLDILDGGEGADELYGMAGNDQIHGGGGNDTRLAGDEGNDIINGGTGADLMDGGVGDDVYYVDNIGDVILEGGGIDTVRAGLDWTLGALLERLILEGSASLNGTGNGLANVLTGNGGANVLDGMSEADILSGGLGDDTLIGGTGADILSGGGGADRFVVRQESVFSSANPQGRLVETDVVADYALGLDIIDLSAVDAIVGGADDAFTLVAAFDGQAGRGVLKFASGATTLELDIDGDRSADYRLKINGDVRGDTASWLF